MARKKKATKPRDHKKLYEQEKIRMKKAKDAVDKAVAKAMVKEEQTIQDRSAPGKILKAIKEDIKILVVCDTTPQATDLYNKVLDIARQKHTTILARPVALEVHLEGTHKIKFICISKYNKATKAFKNSFDRMIRHEEKGKKEKGKEAD